MSEQFGIHPDDKALREIATEAQKFFGQLQKLCPANERLYFLYSILYTRDTNHTKDGFHIGHIANGSPFRFAHFISLFASLVEYVEILEEQEPDFKLLVPSVTLREALAELDDKLRTLHEKDPNEAVN